MNAAKETFVSGHEGTTAWEIAAVLVSVVACYTLRNVLLVVFPRLSLATRGSILLAFFLDFSVLVLPGILLFTVLADHAFHFCLLSIGLVGALAVFSIWSTPGKPGCVGSVTYPLAKLPFITAMRTYTNLFTAIAILAVDFTIFPRRFAKTETYGTGLMDIGVGLFVVAHGLTAPEARGLSNTRGYIWRVIGTVRRVLPLIVLGCVRLASVKLTGYQEHVTEYGVHWNFFFTIAFIRVLCTAILPLLSFLPLLFPYATLSLLLAFLHQLFLSLAGGTEYVLLGPSRDGSRTGLLSANREGVVSSIGYLAVYMAGIQLGQWLFKKRKTVSKFYHVALFLGVGVVLLWTLTSVCEVYVQPVSRRMANLPFILWLFSQVFLFLLLFLFTDLLLLKLWHTVPSSSLPSPLYTTASNKHTTSLLCVVSAIDYNQLSFFLLANILTGLVNFSLDTLHTSRPLALAVLVGYMCVLVFISIALHRHSIKIKL